MVFDIVMSHPNMSTFHKRMGSRYRDHGGNGPFLSDSTTRRERPNPGIYSVCVEHFDVYLNVNPNPPALNSVKALS